MALDQKALNELRELDPDGSSGLLANIIGAYLKDAPEQLRHISDALAAQDIAALVRHAHSLRSASQSLGASRVAQIAGEIESAGKNQAIGGCRLLQTILAAEYASAERLLKAESAVSRATTGL
jgi:HPt (histidine-containing phosphotransfer) domain-containing protein